MRFPGKRAVWWYGVLFILAAACLFVVWTAITEPGPASLLSAVFMALAFLLALSIQIRNDLTLEEEALLIRFGLMTRRIPYLAIRSLEPSKSPLASTATSLDRIAITLYSGGLYYVSVRDRELFIAQLRARRTAAFQGDLYDLQND